MDILQQNAKGITALLIAALASYFTPEVINAVGLEVSELVKVAVIAGLTAFMVWLVPNKPV